MSKAAHRAKVLAKLREPPKRLLSHFVTTSLSELVLREMSQEIAKKMDEVMRQSFLSTSLGVSLTKKDIANVCSHLKRRRGPRPSGDSS